MLTRPVFNHHLYLNCKYHLKPITIIYILIMDTFIYTISLNIYIYFYVAFLLPLGLILSLICHMASSHKNSSKLLKNAIIWSCFLKL